MDTKYKTSEAPASPQWRQEHVSMSWQRQMPVSPLSWQPTTPLGSQSLTCWALRSRERDFSLIPWPSQRSAAFASLSPLRGQMLLTSNPLPLKFKEGTSWMDRRSGLEMLPWLGMPVFGLETRPMEIRFSASLWMSKRVQDSKRPKSKTNMLWEWHKMLI